MKMVLNNISHDKFGMKSIGLRFLERNTGKKYADTVPYLPVFAILNKINIYKCMYKKYKTYNKKSCTLRL